MPVTRRMKPVKRGGVSTTVGKARHRHHSGLFSGGRRSLGYRPLPRNFEIPANLPDGSGCLGFGWWVFFLTIGGIILISTLF